MIEYVTTGVAFHHVQYGTETSSMSAAKHLGLLQLLVMMSWPRVSVVCL